MSSAIYNERIEPKFEMIVIQAQENISSKNDPPSSSENLIDTTILKKASHLNTLLSTLSGCVYSFTALFITNALTTENMDSAKSEIEEYSERIIDVFFSMLDDLLKFDPDDVFLASPATICAVLSSVKKESVNVSSFLFNHPRQLAEFIDGFMERLVLTFMEQSIIRFIACVNSPLGDATLTSRVEELEKIVINTLTVDCLEIFKRFLEWDVSRLLGIDFLGKVRDGLDSFWTNLFESVQVFLGLLTG
jgi:hypothetical protein